VYFSFCSLNGTYITILQPSLICSAQDTTANNEGGPTRPAQILVHPPNGPCISITLSQHATVADVMIAVHDAHGLPPASQVITFSGKPLLAGMPLSSLSLTQGCTIRVSERLLGGGNKASSCMRSSEDGPQSIITADHVGGAVVAVVANTPNAEPTSGVMTVAAQAPNRRDDDTAVPNLVSCYTRIDLVSLNIKPKCDFSCASLVFFFAGCHHVGKLCIVFLVRAAR
jgi:hypothetical protein